MSETFRPRSNFAWASAAMILIALFAINSIFYGPDGAQSLFELTVCFILMIASYLVWIRPKLVLDDVGVEVVNPITVHRIKYEDILDLDTKWSLKITHSEGQVRVWVAPASGKRRWIAERTFGWYGSGVPMSETKGDDAETMSASLSSLSGQAAYMIRERMKRRH